MKPRRPVFSVRGPYQGHNIGGFVVNLFFRIFEINWFCFVVAVFDLVHDVVAIVYLT